MKRRFTTSSVVYLLAGWMTILVSVSYGQAEEGKGAEGNVSTNKQVGTTNDLSAGLRKFKLHYAARNSEGEKEERERQVFLWYPTHEAEERYNYRPQIGFAKENAPVAPGQHPVVLFSHGYLGVADQTIFMTEELARKGYIVAGLHHADSLGVKRDKPLPFPNFADAEKWSDAKFVDRREDVVALLEHLLSENNRPESDLADHVNVRQIGALGHSLGGYTVLGLAGGWPKWKEDRIQAVVALSPYITPYLAHETIDQVQQPVMLQGGTWDVGISPFLPSLYDRMRSPRFLIVLKNETHFGWTNLVSLGKTTKECISEGNPELMTRYTVEFFDQYLCGKKSPGLVAEEPRLHQLLAQPQGGPTSGNALPFIERRLKKQPEK